MNKNKLLTFITSNSGKLAELQACLPFVIGKQIDLPEIQEIDIKKIIHAKLQAAVAVCDGPVIVDDTALYLECFASKNGDDGLPGPLIKWFLQTVTNEGLATIAQKIGKNKARACTIIGYADETGQMNFFEGPISGKIVEVNEKLKKNLKDLNNYPESKGWLFKIESSNLKELEEC